jgi:hypothetical protein
VLQVMFGFYLRVGVLLEVHAKLQAALMKDQA